MSNEINIFFACDDRFAKFTYVTLTSIMENASKDYFYNFYVLNTNITDKMKKIAPEVIKNYGNCKVEFVDVSSYLEEMADRLPIRDYYSNATYYILPYYTISYN